MAHSNRTSFDNPVIEWIDYRLPIFSLMTREYAEFPTPKNFNYFWNFGAIAMVVLVVMIVTGIFLAMHYVPHVDHAFDSVELIMRDVNYGWLIRYIHMNGASMFFIAVYIHMFRGLYYGSYKAPRELLWMLGVVILLLMMGTAFMGYVLPWGQMSLWGATVITQLFGAIPIVGDQIVTLLWGGFAVDNPTLKRFFALHYLLPFVIVGVVVMHVWALHVHGSNNPTGIEPKGPQDTIPFHPYYTIKDSVGLTLFLVLWALFVFYAPNALGHADNYIRADSLVTPPHIVPEWYFLPFYAMLRAITFDLTIPFTGLVLIEAKLGGVIVMFSSILILFVLPWLDTSPVRSSRFRPIYRQFFWIFAAVCLILGWCGAKPAEGIYVLISQIATAWYFLHFLLFLPMLGWFETPRPRPESISASVLGVGGGVAAAGAAQTMEKS